MNLYEVRNFRSEFSSLEINPCASKLGKRTRLTFQELSPCHDAEDGLGAVLVGKVVVAALPTAVVGEAQSAREKERVGACLAAPREPLPLGRDREVRPRVEAGRGEVRGRGDLVARLAAVELGEKNRLTIESLKKVIALSVICMTF